VAVHRAHLGRARDAAQALADEKMAEPPTYLDQAGRWVPVIANYAYDRGSTTPHDAEVPEWPPGHEPATWSMGSRLKTINMSRVRVDQPAGRRAPTPCTVDTTADEVIRTANPIAYAVLISRSVVDHDQQVDDWYRRCHGTLGLR
jgi:hypothetical protein